MPNLRPNSLAVESSRSTLSALLAQCEDITHYIASFRGVNLEAARQALARLPQMQRSWAALSRSASKDEISAAIALATAGFPNTTRAELHYFGRLLRQEFTALQPSLFVLTSGCRKLLQDHEFLSISAAVCAFQRKAATHSN